MQDKLVVSLSSIPPRFPYLGKTLKCLLDQINPADEIQLYIPRSYRRFPEHSFSLPEVPQGITVKIADHDLGPATKVLYCAKAHWGTKTRIIYCDDDRLPERNWLKKFVEASKKNPDKAIVSRGLQLRNLGVKTITNYRYPRAEKKHKSFSENLGYMTKRIYQKCKEGIYRKSFQKPQKSGGVKFNKSGYVDIAEGCGGVSIWPSFFGLKAFDIPPVVWTVDDIWLSGLLEKRGIGIWVAKSIPPPDIGLSEGTDALQNFVSEGHSRDSANIFAINYMQNIYSVWI